MKTCPYCLGQIPAAAVKCQHCGEWLDGRASSDQNGELGRAAQRYISLKIIMGVVGLIIGLLFFFFFWLPQWNRVHREFDNFPKSFSPTQGLPKGS